MLPSSGNKQMLDSGQSPVACVCSEVWHTCTSKRVYSGRTARPRASSEPRSGEAAYKNSSPPYGNIDESPDNREQVEAEACETDSEDEISLDVSIPYARSESFPVVPLPSTLDRAGYENAAKKVEKYNAAEVKGKAKAQQQVDRPSALLGNDHGQRQSAEVLVPRQRAGYTFADALEATEGLRHFSDGDGDEDECF
ncbi:hypothetical protein J1614_006014 [Plenodomus biglobosus]|nr:hypothetical protein J1614_006014 [Plenodomus biglobosus]